MRFKRLYIENLASLERAELDFENAPLTDPIFLVSGDTGTGKSTLLDAICLALYANSPRFKSSTNDKFSIDGGASAEVPGNDPKQILRDSADKGFSELVFEGNDGIVYTARWSVRRKRNLESAYEWTLGFTEGKTAVTIKKVTEVREKIEAVTGLNYEQFCRTTLLAQGEFTKFLKSGDNEKSEILEKLTDTGHFARMGRRIYETYAEKKNFYARIRQEIADMTVLSEEELAEKEAEKTRLQEALGGLTAETEKLRLKYAWLKRTLELESRLQQADKAAALARGEVESPAYRAENRILQDWEISEDARNDLRRGEEAERELARVSAAMEEKRSVFAGLLGGMGVLEKFLSDSEAAIAAAETRLGEVAHENPQELEKRRRRHETALADLTKYGDAGTAVAKTEREFAEGGRILENLGAKTGALKEDARLCAERLDAAREDLETMQKGVGDVAKGLRATLTVGSPCPVCGQKIAERLTDEYFENLYAPAKKRYDAAEKAYKSADGLWRTNLAEIKAKRESLDAVEKRLQEERETERQRRLQLAEVLQALGYTAEAAEISTVADASAVGASAEATEIPAAASTEALKGKLQAAETSLQEQIKLLHDLEIKRQNLQNGRQAYASAAALTARIRAQFDKGAEIAASNNKAVKDIVLHLSNLQGELQSLVDSRRAAADLREKCTERLSKFFADNPHIDRNRLVELTACKNRIETYKADCKRKQDALTAATAYQAQSREEMRLHRAEEPGISEGETLPVLEAALSEAERKREDANRRLGALEQIMKDDAKARKKLAERSREEEKCRTEFEKWDKLNTLFGDATGSKFRRIVLNFIMDELLFYANGHLAQLSDRYRLENSFGSFVILVRDMHDCGRLRSAASLSGGESFLVSLALALGLSAFSGARFSTDILFIDEGFGTLSGNALEPALSALERLHGTDGRKVCIISHVPALRERIPTQIKVERVDPTCSRVFVAG